MFWRNLCTGLGALILTVVAISQWSCQRAESRSLSGDAIYEMNVPDMVCEGCAIGVTEALEGVKGVEEVQVLVEEKRVRVGVQSSLLVEEKGLQAAVQDAGYEVKGFTKRQ